jgi:hypothetical protein
MRGMTDNITLIDRNSGAVLQTNFVDEGQTTETFRANAKRLLGRYLRDREGDGSSFMAVLVRNDEVEDAAPIQREDL